jgi:hypothetical protein
MAMFRGTSGSIHNFNESSIACAETVLIGYTAV